MGQHPQPFAAAQLMSCHQEAEQLFWYADQRTAGPGLSGMSRAMASEPLLEEHASAFDSVSYMAFQLPCSRSWSLLRVYVLCMH